MGRFLESGLQFSLRSTSKGIREVKHEKAQPDRSAIDDKQCHVLVLEDHDCDGTNILIQEEEADRPLPGKRRRRWEIRVGRAGRGKLVTPVVRYLKRFRQSMARFATAAAPGAAPLRLPAGCKLGRDLLAKLHLSRKRNSRKIHSILTYSSAASDEQAPLLRDPSV